MQNIFGRHITILLDSQNICKHFQTCIHVVLVVALPYDLTICINQIMKKVLCFKDIVSLIYIGNSH